MQHKQDAFGQNQVASTLIPVFSALLRILHGQKRCSSRSFAAFRGSRGF